MNQIKSALAAVLLGFVLVGCAEPPLPETPASEPAPEPPAQVYAACLVTDKAVTGEGSPSEQARIGLERARNELGIVTSSIESSPDVYSVSLQAMVDAQCNLVIGVGSEMAAAVEAAAKTNPTVRFGLLDATPNTAPTNLRPVLFSTHESSFLAGYLAAASSASGKVGVFGGLPVPAVTIYMDGFIQGVAHYNQVKGTTVEALGWDPSSQDGAFVKSATSPWADADAGRAAAAALVAQGADVIMPVAAASGVGALQLAQESGTLKIIWSDTNGCLTQPDYCGVLLGSVVKQRDAAVFELVKTDHEGRSAAGIFTAALRNDGTALVEAMPGSLEGPIAAELEALSKQIVDGTIKVTSDAAIG